MSSLVSCSILVIFLSTFFQPVFIGSGCHKLTDYLTEPGTSSSSVAVPSLAELPSLIVAQLLPESAAASSRGSAVTRVWPRVSPQLPSRRQQECNLTLHFSPYQCLIGSLRVEQGGLPHRAVEVHGGVLFGGRHHFCEDFQV